MEYTVSFTARGVNTPEQYSAVLSYNEFTSVPYFERAITSPFALIKGGGKGNGGKLTIDADYMTRKIAASYIEWVKRRTAGMLTKAFIHEPISPYTAALAMYLQDIDFMDTLVFDTFTVNFIDLEEELVGRGPAIKIIKDPQCKEAVELLLGPDGRIWYVDDYNNIYMEAHLWKLREQYKNIPGHPLDNSKCRIEIHQSNPRLGIPWQYVAVNPWDEISLYKRTPKVVPITFIGGVHTLASYKAYMYNIITSKVKSFRGNPDVTYSVNDKYKTIMDIFGHLTARKGLRGPEISININNNLFNIDYEGGYGRQFITSEAVNSNIEYLPPNILTLLVTQYLDKHKNTSQSINKGKYDKFITFASDNKSLAQFIWEHDPDSVREIFALAQSISKMSLSDAVQRVQRIIKK
jgi:hypothetical protein